MKEIKNMDGLAEYDELNEAIEEETKNSKNKCEDYSKKEYEDYLDG